MKIVHIESGLGNQMLGYVEYLAIKRANPDDDVCVETMIYEIPQCNETICQWNGYELERVFGIQAPNVRDRFSKEQYQAILNEVAASRFWEKNWNYPVYITEALAHAGWKLKNLRGDFEHDGTYILSDYTSAGTSLRQRLHAVLRDFAQTRPGYHTLRILRQLFSSRIAEKNAALDTLFHHSDASFFTGQWLWFKRKGNRIDLLDDEFRAAFTFPPITDERNARMAEYLRQTQSVAIHARRGDMMGENRRFYEYGYFRRAVRYIKRHVSHPVFVFFSDPGSIEWCKENDRVFGLDSKRDEIRFVDWNKDGESFRDMQLMTLCKHNITTLSTFGWWGAYLNENPDKITCTPDARLIATHAC